MAKKSKNISSDLRREEISPLTGKVVRNTGASYIVRTESGQLLPCRVKGNFRIKGIRTTNPVAVGDNVGITMREGDTHFITTILPRRNYIIRRASNLSKESHILAANVDRAILVATIADPLTPLNFIDRFLATAEAYNIPGTLVLNKSDLWDDEERELAESIKYLYDSLGYHTHIVSASTGDGIDTLREVTSRGISLMGGNSGVGKSSLINTLAPGTNLRTGAISDAHHTGMHTTTFSEMVTLPGGGEIIDIPGVKGFGVIDFAPGEVSHFFPEIFRIAEGCRYSDCKHIGEPGCSVKQALEEHRIAESRYASYLSILEEASENREDEKYRKPF